MASLGYALWGAILVILTNVVLFLVAIVVGMFLSRISLKLLNGFNRTSWDIWKWAKEEPIFGADSGKAEAEHFI